jgi:hypothetical protein
VTAFARFVILATALALAGCFADAPAGGARVWSTASSSDGTSECPKGTTVTGGGYTMAPDIQALADVRVVSSAPDGNGWKVVCIDGKSQPIKGCRAFAVCASVLAH